MTTNKLTNKVLLLLFLQLFYSCICNECEENPDGSIETIGENDLSLKFNYLSNQYQMIHVDFKRNFIILAQPKLIGANSLQLKSKIIEPKGCEKLSLVNAEYIIKCPNQNSIPTHHLKFVVKKKTSDKKKSKIAIDSIFNFAKGDNFDVHIFYEGEDNEDVLGKIPDENCNIIKPIDDERICRTEVIGTN